MHDEHDLCSCAGHGMYECVCMRACVRACDTGLCSKVRVATWLLMCTRKSVSVSVCV